MEKTYGDNNRMNTPEVLHPAYISNHFFFYLLTFLVCGSCIIADFVRTEQASSLGG